MEVKKSCTKCLKQKYQVSFYSKGSRCDSLCKECRKEKRKDQYRKSSILIAKPNFESIHVNVKLIVSSNNWSSLLYPVLKSNFLESNDPQVIGDIKNNNKLNVTTEE